MGGQAVIASAVDEVLMGNVLQAGLGQNPAREAGRCGVSGGAALAMVVERPEGAPGG